VVVEYDYSQIVVFSSDYNNDMSRRVPLFDPLLVPIQYSGLDEPAIAHNRLTPELLRARFQQKKEWTPEITDESLQSIQEYGPQALRVAAVLIPIVIRHQEPMVILTLRASHLNDHAGQISFPGGRQETTDPNIEFTAKREAFEEIGLPESHVEILGSLPDYMTITGYQVSPVVSLVTTPPKLIPDSEEVAEIFEVPLAFLMNPANHQVRQWDGPLGSRRFYAMPYESKFIWGATAGMIRNLYHFLSPF